MIGEFVIDLEETERINIKDIVCLKDGQGKRQYFRMSPDKDNNLALTPLTSEQLKELGIEETLAGQTSDEINIEETEQPKKGFNVQSEEDMKKAAEFAQKRLKELAKEKGEGEDVEGLKQENENLRTKLQIISEKELERQMTDAKVPEDLKATFREHPQQFVGWKQAQPKQPEKHEVQSGSAPLNDQQMGRQSPPTQYTELMAGQTFEDTKSMIDYLHKVEHEGSPQAQKTAKNILNRLLLKTLIGVQNQPEKVRIDSPEDPRDQSSELDKILGPERERIRKRALQGRGQ